MVQPQQLRAFRFVGHGGAVRGGAAFGNFVASARRIHRRLWLPSVKGESTTIKAHIGSALSTSRLTGSSS